MKIITKKYFLDNLKSKNLKKYYIPGIGLKILGNNIINWEAACYFQLDDGRLFLLEYNLDSILTSDNIKEEDLYEKLYFDDWSLIKTSDKFSHSLNNLNKALDWSCQYSIKNNQALYEKLRLNLSNGTWKLENNQIKENILFSLKIDNLFNTEFYLYIGIDELSIYPYKIQEVKDKIHFIKQLIEWKV